MMRSLKVRSRISRRGRRTARRLLFALSAMLLCSLGFLITEAAARGRQGAPGLVFLEHRDRRQAQARARRAGGQAGQVEISLAWDTRDDLDVHVVEPDGTEIFYERKRSRSGGELDVDMNVFAESASGVEHIRWPRGRTMAAGRYRVLVDHFKAHAGSPTAFVLSATCAAGSTDFEGTVRHGDPMLRVCDVVVDAQGAARIVSAGAPGVTSR